MKAVPSFVVISVLVILQIVISMLTLLPCTHLIVRSVMVCRLVIHSQLDRWSIFLSFVHVMVENRLWCKKISPFESVGRRNGRPIVATSICRLVSPEDTATLRTVAIKLNNWNLQRLVFGTSEFHLLDR